MNNINDIFKLAEKYKKSHTEEEEQEGEAIHTAIDYFFKQARSCGLTEILL